MSDSTSPQLDYLYNVNMVEYQSSSREGILWRIWIKEQLAAKVSKILRDSFEPGVVTNDFTPVMGCEEFSLFQQEVPGPLSTFHQPFIVTLHKLALCQLLKWAGLAYQHVVRSALDNPSTL